jgi:hypothetical protein
MSCCKSSSKTLKPSQPTAWTFPFFIPLNFFISCNAVQHILGDLGDTHAQKSNFTLAAVSTLTTSQLTWNICHGERLDKLCFTGGEMLHYTFSD